MSFRSMTAAFVVAGLAVSAPASAQQYPTQPVTLVVAFAAGGFADSVARLFSEELGKKLGQSIVVENRGGAGGNLGARTVVNAPTDGHTILVTTTSVAVNDTLYKNKGYASDDLRGVAIVGSTPEALIVNPANPAKNLQEFLANAKTKGITFGTAGGGTRSYIAGEYFFKHLAKVEAIHVPYQGGAPAMNALMGGHVDSNALTLPPAVPHINSGRLRGIAIASEKRIDAVKDVPTYAESGFPGFVATSWVGFFIHAKTSDAIVTKLNGAIGEILKTPEVQAKLKTMGLEPKPGTAPDAQAFFKSEIDNWGKMVRTIGATVE
jgi:tripartite-type tricarboxylate transporter receptor subunit TctC